MLKPLTPKQLRFLQHLEAFARVNGYMPSYAEVADKLKLKSLATVSKHFDALRVKGYVSRAFNVPRSAEITEEARQYLKTLPAARRAARVKAA